MPDAELPAPPTSGPDEHVRRLDAALAELAGDRDAGPARPRRSWLHGLARLGLRVRPPYYYGFLGAWAYYAVLLVPPAGLGMWTLVWRHDDVRPRSMLATSLEVGLGCAAVAALLAMAIARLRRLTRWHAL